MGNSQDFANILIELNSRLSPIEKVNQTPRQSFSKIKVQTPISIPFHSLRSLHSIPIGVELFFLKINQTPLINFLD